MNKIKRTVAFLLMLFIVSGVYGQVPIEKSEKQIFVLGKKYYLHEVKKGQTLYSIAKAYDISEHEIIAENSELVNGLKTGKEIKIPAKDGNVQKKENEPSEFIYHTVEKKQTLYYLSNKYNVSESELVKLNPEIKQGLKVGQIVKVPKPGTAVADAGTGCKLHTVQPGETLFSIAKQYEIEISSLKVENPELKDQGPRIGQVIRIPLVKKSFEDVLKITHQNATVSAGFNEDPLYFEQEGVSPCNDFKYTSNVVFKVAVLLPLYIDENYVSKNAGSYYKNSDRFYQFYQGMLLASKKMKESGVSTEFYIKDTKAPSTKINEILRDEVMKEMDLIIGPVYSEDFKVAGDFAKENKINIVAPFKQKSDEMVVNNPFIFLADPSDETEIGNISKFIAKSNNRSIVFVHYGSAEELKIAETFKSKLVSTFSANENVNEIVFKQVNYSSGGAAALEDALSVGLENVVIIPSKNVVSITNLATKLNYLAGKYKITVYGMHPWEQLESMELGYLEHINFHYGTTNFVDHQDEKVKLFDYQYKTYFKNEATIYSYLGYDIANYFLNALKDNGKHFQFCIGSQDNKDYNKGLRFDFNFERISPFSGFENNWIRIVKVDKNLEIVRAK